MVNEVIEGLSTMPGIYQALMESNHMSSYKYIKAFSDLLISSVCQTFIFFSKINSFPGTRYLKVFVLTVSKRTLSAIQSLVCYFDIPNKLVQ